MRPRRPSEDDWEAIQARHRRMYVYRTLLGALALVVSGWLVLTKGVVPTQSELDARALLAPKPPQPFRPVYPIDPRILSSIDMARVHGRLLPAWIISLQHSPYSVGYWEAENAFSALRDEAGKDPNLGLLLDRLHERVMDSVYDFRGEIGLLIKGWNEYMARAGVPFRLEYHMQRTAHGPEIRMRSYRVVADVPISAEHSPYHVLLLAREDRTNLVEAFFGQTATDRDTALVMTDRIAEYAIDRLWPLFDTKGEPSEPEPALLEKVRGEARLALGDSVIDRLARNFSVHRALETEVAELGHRRGCGGSVVIERVPWDGLSDRALAMVNRVAQKNEKRGCPRLTVTDADRLGAISHELRGNGALEQALGRLAGWLVKAVAVHEARHLADERSTPEGAAGPCRGCPKSFDYRVQSEISAYLASFATEGLGYVALLQACGADAHSQASHSIALEFLLPRLLVDGCGGAIPDDLYARAAALRAHLFGRDGSIELPQSFPGSVPVPRVCASH
ncbi:MAG: hypothetical protein JW940_12470 [Polyangiaceae bacterium]|nr:hypothetical protein [Polyangiaceae bacterium]